MCSAVTLFARKWKCSDVRMALIASAKTSDRNKDVSSSYMRAYLGLPSVVVLGSICRDASPVRRGPSGPSATSRSQTWPIANLEIIGLTSRTEKLRNWVRGRLTKAALFRNLIRRNVDSSTVDDASNSQKSPGFCEIFICFENTLGMSDSFVITENVDNRRDDVFLRWWFGNVHCLAIMAPAGTRREICESNGSIRNSLPRTLSANCSQEASFAFLRCFFSVYIKRYKKGGENKRGNTIRTRVPYLRRRRKFDKTELWSM